MNLIAKTFQGLEEELAKEITSLGGREVRVLKRAVSFTGDKALMYRVNLRAATALRVLVHLFEFRFYDQKSYYRQMREFRWEQHMHVDNTFAIDAVVQSKVFPHTRMAMYKAKDAIVDRFRDRTGRRPNVATREEDVRIHVFVKDRKARVYLDSSGSSLHLRGYKRRVGVAPLNEVLAAGLLRLSDWDATLPLIDPMCGSGTLPIEAALMAARRPVNALRSFGFMKWLSFEETIWNKVYQQAMDEAIEADCVILGGDKQARMIEVARANAARAGVERLVHFEHRDMKDWDRNGNPGVLLFNPPYDKRMEEADVRAFYHDIGDMLKQNWQAHTAWMITANLDALKFVGLKASRRIPLFNGPLESRLVRYELYKGRKEGII